MTLSSHHQSLLKFIEERIRYQISLAYIDPIFFFFWQSSGFQSLPLCKVYLKYVRTHCIVTKTKVSLFFNRLKPDNPKFFSTLDNNKELSFQNVNIACFKINVLSTVCQSKILLLLQKFLHVFLIFDL